MPDAYEASGMVLLDCVVGEGHQPPTHSAHLLSRMTPGDLHLPRAA
jgi:hypothetical protein